MFFTSNVVSGWSWENVILYIDADRFLLTGNILIQHFYILKHFTNSYFINAILLFNIYSLVCLFVTFNKTIDHLRHLWCTWVLYLFPSLVPFIIHFTVSIYCNCKTFLMYVAFQWYIKIFSVLILKLKPWPNCFNFWYYSFGPIELI